MIGWLLGRIGGYLWPAVGIAFAVLMLALGWQTKRVTWAKAETVQVQSAWALDRAHAQAEALRITTEYRAEEQRRAAAHQEIVDATERKLTQVRADAAIADAAAGKLQQRVAALVAEARRAATNPGPAGASPPASDPADVLANVLGSCVAAVRQLAVIADERGAAGNACEQSYGALTPTNAATNPP